MCSPTFTTSAVVCIPVRSVGVDKPWAWAAATRARFSWINDKIRAAVSS
jgi:hypothetical protein